MFSAITDVHAGTNLYVYFMLFYFAKGAKPRHLLVHVLMRT